MLTAQDLNAGVIGKQCRLLRLIRDREDRNRFKEQALILREVNNLDRRMYLVRFDDGATTISSMTRWRPEGGCSLDGLPFEQ